MVLGAGGFVSGPGGVAAWLTRRPLVIHEQNAVAGMTNRALARLARRVLEAFPGSLPPGAHAEQVGHPVAARSQRSLACEAFRGARRVAARARVGGSQGAARLNAVVLAAPSLTISTSRPLVHHQAGERHADAAREAYAKHAVQADVRAFIDDMAEMYAWADLVVCRSGALTVSELAAAGLPAIFGRSRLRWTIIRR